MSLLRAPDGRLHAPWRVLAFLGLCLLGYLAVAAIVTALELQAVPKEPVPLLFTGLLTLVPASAATWMMLRRYEALPWSYALLHREAARPALMARGAAFGALAIGVPILLLLALGWTRFVSAADGSVAGTAVVIALFLAPAALAEELLLRGYPFAVLRERYGVVAALLITSLTFGVLHAGNPGATVLSIAAVTLAGIFLGVVMVATGSLWAAWAAHFAWNLTMVLFHAPVSGWPFPTPAYRLVDAGPEWATGGRWGPEGGVIACAAMLVGAFLIGRASNAPWGKQRP